MKCTLGGYLRQSGGDEYATYSFEATDNRFYWILIPRAEREDITNASPANPTDMTYLIYNQSFNHNEGEAASSGRGHWTFTHDGGNIAFRGGNSSTNANTCMEVWNANSFNISQTFTGLENGIYRFSIQGYYRTGGDNNDANGNLRERIAGTEETINAYFYANEVSEKFPSIFDSEIHDYNALGSEYLSSAAYDINGTNYYIPTSMARASKCFAAGYYNKSLEVVVANGTLTIGARCDVANAGQWAIFDNFRLEYLGKLNEFKEELNDYLSSVQAKVDDLDTDGQAAFEENEFENQIENDAFASYEEGVAAIDAAYIAAIKAQTTSGTDMTSIIVNPGFEDTPWGNGWEGCGTGTAWDGSFVKQTSAQTNFSGNFAEMWGWFPGNTLKQTVTGLHDGYYKIEAYAIAIDQIDNSRTPIARFFAKSGELLGSHEFVNDAPAALQSEIVRVSGGILEFGIEAYYSNEDINHNTWIAADNWKLTFLGYESLDVNIADDVNYGTLICPFDIALPEGLKAYSCNEISGETLVLDEIEGTLPANTPAILYSENGIETTFYGNDESEDVEYTEGYLTGVYISQEAPNGSYVLQNHEGTVKFYVVDDSYTQPYINPHRCYLTVPESAGIKAFGFDIADAIKKVDIDASVDVIYNLAGQQVDDNYKGIIIRNGKKYINK